MCLATERKLVCAETQCVSCPAAVVFTVDMITTLCTGLVIVHNLRQAVVMDRKIVAKHYLLHGTLSIDIIATGPLWVEVGTAQESESKVTIRFGGFIMPCLLQSLQGVQVCRSWFSSLPMRPVCRTSQSCPHPARCCRCSPSRQLAARPARAR
jgi:hypothetical protein